MVIKRYGVESAGGFALCWMKHAACCMAFQKKKERNNGAYGSVVAGEATKFVCVCGFKNVK